MASLEEIEQELAAVKAELAEVLQWRSSLNKTCAELLSWYAPRVPTGFLRNLKGEYTPISEVDAEMMNHRKVK